MEMKSRLSLLAKVVRKTADLVATAMIRMLVPLGLPLYALLSDNSKEFVHHEAIAQVLKARFFLVHLNASWERGVNEVTNNLYLAIFSQGSIMTILHSSSPKSP